MHFAGRDSLQIEACHDTERVVAAPESPEKVGVYVGRSNFNDCAAAEYTLGLSEEDSMINAVTDLILHDTV